MYSITDYLNNISIVIIFMNNKVEEKGTVDKT